MSVDEIRHKAQQHYTTARLKAFSGMMFGILLCFCFVWAFARAHDVVQRLGWGLLSLWGIYYSYQVYRWIWPGRLMPDAEANTSLEFYRSALERQRNYDRHLWRRSGLGFCFLGLAIVLVPPLIKSLGSLRLLLNFVPFSVLLIVWLATFLYTRKRNRQKLEKQIEQLRSLEK